MSTDYELAVWEKVIRSNAPALARWIKENPGNYLVLMPDIETGDDGEKLYVFSYEALKIVAS